MLVIFFFFSFILVNVSLFSLNYIYIALFLQLRIYHFNPPGVLHPITTIYELNYGETEMKQGNYFNYVV